MSIAQDYYVGGKPPSRQLSPEHSNELDRSGISPAVAAARRVRTIRRRSDLPDAFPDWQRRLGLLFPCYSPDGETTGYQLKPRKPIRRKREDGPKYETPAESRSILDVNPLMLEEVRSGIGDLWITEGVKKVDSLTSQGLPTVGIVGVWNIAVSGTKGKTPLPCWSHVRLRGRRVYVCYDADARTNPHVQEALRRLVAMLEGFGAVVLVVYLPDVQGDGKAGVDDYLGAGGTVAELRTMAAPFEPVDIARERMSRDERLRSDFDSLWRAWHDEDWMRFKGTEDRGNWQRGHTARDVKAALIGLVPSIGKPDAGGVVVEIGSRRLAELSAKSSPSTCDALKHLEADGQIEILPAPDKTKPRRYRLLVPDRLRSAALCTMEGSGAREAQAQEIGPRCKGLRYPSASRLRWPSPARSGRLVRRRDGVTGRTVTEAVGENVFVDRDYQPYGKRLGPHRCAVLDILEAAGGEMHLKDLCAALHRKRPWDVRRRILKPLEEAGIIECEGDVIRLVPAWLARLDDRRKNDGEIEQAEKQATRHREDRDRYRLHLQRQKHGTPKASIEAVHRTHELRDRRLREIRKEEERDKAPTPPAVDALVSRILGQHERVRMGLLCEIAAEEGLRWRDVPPAVRRMGYRVERLSEYGNAEFVYADRVAAA